MSDDGRISQQPLHVAGPEPSHLLRHESSERTTERLALAKDRQPRRPRWEALEAELLVDAHVVDNRPPPLVIVVREVLRRRRRPCTSLQSVVAPHDVGG